MNAPKIKLIVAISALVSLVVSKTIGQESRPVQLLEEVKISDFGMYFDGRAVAATDRLSYADVAGQYDFAFGSRITPHGDCIEIFGDFVFLTWYRGPETDRHVMLTRYNMKTGTQATIEFEHRHTGFQNIPNLGESHNTIAVGICAVDQSVHLLYDMHAYSPSRPSDGSLSEDYFRYQFSIPGAAVVADDEFTLDKFNPKQLYLRPDDSYLSLTYPNFFTNADGELLVVMREGGNNNGKYQFARYDGTEWSRWIEFNTLNAKTKGYPHNWGLYGDMKVFDGLFHIGFATRYSDNNDRYVYNNGTHYAYSTDPSGLSNWFNADGESVDIPVINPDSLKVSEPGDVFPDTQDPNSIRMSGGVDWTVTPSGALHFKSSVKNDNTGVTKNIHTFRRAGDTEFTISTDFPGGSLYAFGRYVFLIGLENGRPVIHRAFEGTNQWETVYSTNVGKIFRHGTVRIIDGKLFYYLMEQKSGSAQPIYLQIFDLGEGGSSVFVDAGIDQVVMDTDLDGFATVQLDGWIPNTVPASNVMWTLGGKQIAQGLTPSIELVFGVHTLTLSAQSGEELLEDEVQIRVDPDRTDKPTIIVAWDQWDTPDATFINGASGTFTTGTLFSPTSLGASDDGTFGTIDTPTASTDASGTTEGLRSFFPTNTATFTIVNGTEPIELEMFHFDAARRGADGSKFQLEVLDGSAIDVGLVSEGVMASTAGSDLQDFDVDLRGLWDRHLEAGESAIFKLSFLDGTGQLALDNVAVSIPAPKQVFGYPDMDDDLLPDFWETLYIKSMNEDGDSDTDNDGRSHLQEFIEQTLPNDARSIFNPSVVNDQEHGLHLRWANLSARDFRILRSSDLNLESWEVVETEFEASEDDLIFPFQEGEGFYILQVKLQ